MLLNPESIRIKFKTMKKLSSKGQVEDCEVVGAKSLMYICRKKQEADVFDEKRSSTVCGNAMSTNLKMIVHGILNSIFTKFITINPMDFFFSLRIICSVTISCLQMKLLWDSL